MAKWTYVLTFSIHPDHYGIFLFLILPHPLGVCCFSFTRKTVNRLWVWVRDLHPVRRSVRIPSPWEYTFFICVPKEEKSGGEFEFHSKWHIYWRVIWSHFLIVKCVYLQIYLLTFSIERSSANVWKSIKSMLFYLILS